MLAEAYLLHLEARLRAAARDLPRASDSGRTPRAPNGPAAKTDTQDDRR